MKTRVYTALGWLVWQGAKVWIRNNRSKLGAGATAVGVVVAGGIAAKLATGDDEE